MVTFSVIVPTIGRPTLARTLQSIIDAGATREDEVFVAGDGRQPAARRIAEGFAGRLRLRYFETDRACDYGGHQRNVATRAAKGSHLLFMDDDDAYRAGAIATARILAEKNPGRILMFKMVNHATRRGWAGKWEVKIPCKGNVSTVMFCVPRIPGRLGEWTSSPCNDFEFLSATLAKWPGGPDAIEWREEVTVDVY